MNWTDERVDLLKKLWADGLSCSQIAAELGEVSRNSVIGKVHRLKLTDRKAKVGFNASTGKRVRKPRASRAAMERQILGPPLQPAQDAPAEPVEDMSVTPIGQRCTIMELTEGKCRWPLWGSNTDHGEYCGGRTAGGLSYCGYHGRMAYQSPRTRKEPGHFPAPPRHLLNIVLKRKSA